MMQMLQCSLFVIIATVIVGTLGTIGLDNVEKQASITEVILRGLIYVFAVFQLLSIPAIYRYMSLHAFAWVVACTLVAMTGGKIIWSVKQKSKIRCGIKHHWDEKTIWNLMALVLIAFQLFMAVAYANTNDDDAFYVATATTAVESDSLYAVNPYTGDPFASFPARYVLSPFPLFYSVISYFTGVSATIMAHIVMHVVFIVLAYGLYAAIGREIFGDDAHKNGVFMTALCVVNICSLGAEHLQGSMLLLRNWQGKAVLATIVIPFIMLQLWRMHKMGQSKTDCVLLFSAMLASCFVSSMGIVLGVVTLGVYGMTDLILKHDIKKFMMTMCCALPNIAYALMYVRIR